MNQSLERLRQTIQTDGAVCAEAVGQLKNELLGNVCPRAQSGPGRFLDYVLTALGRAVREDGLIGEKRVEQIGRIVHGRKRAARQGIERRGADSPLDLNDAMTGRPNHASWNERFVAAIGEHVLEDEESPGQVDPAE